MAKDHCKSKNFKSHVVFNRTVFDSFSFFLLQIQKSKIVKHFETAVGDMFGRRFDDLDCNEFWKCCGQVFGKR
jgi:hypothetical protein